MKKYTYNKNISKMFLFFFIETKIVFIMGHIYKTEALCIKLNIKPALFQLG